MASVGMASVGMASVGMASVGMATYEINEHNSFKSVLVWR